ncbi:hypothetical protein SSX86_015241 [Deinandra increscens subsp. villosa]|uniref:Uncharacterized protein n=1 Tax=Deinandra increscens subsp. villosa TaxID=3103831 RepID=A0AAP0D482_9ASTR
MDNNNQPPSPPPPPPALRYSSAASSLSAQLFGDNDLRHSSAGVFASIFPPPSTGTMDRLAATGYQHSTIDAVLKEWQETPAVCDALNLRNMRPWIARSAENVAKNTVNANSGVMNMERRSIFQERIEPCPLSSSIYYGGQEDMYVRSSTDLTSKSYPKLFVEDDSKDDPNHLLSATRGNWWQGQF